MKKVFIGFLTLAVILVVSGCGKKEVLERVEPFPEIQGVDFQGNKVENSIFSEYDLTIVNFWSNT